MTNQTRPMPGMPAHLAKNADDLKHTAKILAKNAGEVFRFNSMGAVQARVAIGAVRSHVPVRYDGSVMVLRMGGAK